MSHFTGTIQKVVKKADKKMSLQTIARKLKQQEHRRLACRSEPLGEASEASSSGSSTCGVPALIQTQNMSVLLLHTFLEKKV